MYAFLMFLFILICILMVLTILLQSSKGGGLASSFGGMGATSVFSPRGAASFLQKTTTILGIVYILLCLLISNLVRNASTSQESVLQKELNQMEQTAPPPSLPPAPIQEPTENQQNPDN